MLLQDGEVGSEEPVFPKAEVESLHAALHWELDVRERRKW